MDNKYNRFTNDDVLVIKRCLDTYPIRKEAFEHAALELKRSVLSIKDYYYRSKAFRQDCLERRKIKKNHHDFVVKTLSKEIAENPTNISKAIAKTSDITGLKKETITQYYYSKNSYCSRNKIGVCFTLASNKKVVYNGKNTDKNGPKVSKRKSSKLITFFKNLFSKN